MIYGKILFLIWMLCFPLMLGVEAMLHYGYGPELIRHKLYTPEQMGFSDLVNMIIYLYVAYLFWGLEI